VRTPERSEGARSGRFRAIAIWAAIWVGRIVVFWFGIVLLVVAYVLVVGFPRQAQEEALEEERVRLEKLVQDVRVLEENPESFATEEENLREELELLEQIFPLHVDAGAFLRRTAVVAEDLGLVLEAGERLRWRKEKQGVVERVGFDLVGEAGQVAELLESLERGEKAIWGEMGTILKVAARVEQVWTGAETCRASVVVELFAQESKPPVARPADLEGRRVA